MNDNLLLNSIANYTSNSQKIRLITEEWVNDNIYCPNCGENLVKFKNNNPVGDFYCDLCKEQYELKAMKGILGKKIIDGEYNTMIRRLKDINKPNFFFLTYNKSNLNITNFLTIPKYFFINDIIEKRKPLSSSAKRAGWTGCNIIIENIPEFGKIFYIKKGIIQSKCNVLCDWNNTKKIIETQNNSWLSDIFTCIKEINKNEFDLKDVYSFEIILKTKHPFNNNIKEKIRQQLQILRNKNIIDFIGRGKYKKGVLWGNTYF